MNVHRPALTAILGIAFASSGCASGKLQRADESEPGAVVAMHFHSFDPSTVTIHAGETVRWDNQSLIWHTVTADARAMKDPAHVALPEGAKPFDSGKVLPGNGFSHTFTLPGAYRYVCRRRHARDRRGSGAQLPGTLTGL